MRRKDHGIAIMGQEENQKLRVVVLVNILKQGSQLRSTRPLYLMVVCSRML